MPRGRVWSRNEVEVFGDVAHIILPGGERTIVDAAALPEVTAGFGKWCSNKSGTGGCPYAVARRACDRRLVKLHRILSGAAPGLVVDHINHDPLDNRRCNLRVVTQAENVRNRKTA
jgi:hypothetical protein